MSLSIESQEFLSDVQKVVPKMIVEAARPIMNILGNPSNGPDYNWALNLQVSAAVSLLDQIKQNTPTSDSATFISEFHESKFGFSYFLDMVENRLEVFWLVSSPNETLQTALHSISLGICCLPFKPTIMSHPRKQLKESMPDKRADSKEQAIESMVPETGDLTMQFTGLTIQGGDSRGQPEALTLDGTADSSTGQKVDDPLKPSTKSPSIPSPKRRVSICTTKSEHTASSSLE